MKKVVIALAAIAFIAAGCNQTQESESIISAPNSQNNQAKGTNTSGEAMTPDAVINQIDASIQAEQSVMQTDDSDLFKSDNEIKSFSEVKNVN